MPGPKFQDQQGFQPPPLDEFQLSVLEAAIRAETRLGSIAKLADIGDEHGTTLANVRNFVLELVALGYMQAIGEGKRQRYEVVRTPSWDRFDRVKAHYGYVLEQRARERADRPAGPAQPLKGAALEALRAAQRASYRLGRPVSLAEIATERKQPPHVVEKHLPALIQDGFLKAEGNSFLVVRDAKRREVRPPAPRETAVRLDERPANPALQLAEALVEVLQQSDLVHVPILGRAAGGQPIEAATELGELVVPLEWLAHRPAEQFYALRIVGDSMAARPASIADGDVVLVHAEPFDESRSRFTVWVVWDDRLGGAAVKWIHEDTSGHEMLALASSNRAYRPIPTTAGTIVQGRVVKVIRDLE